MSSGKWFYPLQKVAEEKITEKYERRGYCLWQDVCKDRVYEAWDCIRKRDNKAVQVIAVMHKATSFVMLYEDFYQ